MAGLTLLARGDRLADAAAQRQVLADVGLPPFAAAAGVGELRPAALAVVQMNLGKLCNQTCAHCHVDAGPDRRERMDRDTMLACLDLAVRGGAATVDLTGGAPELNPDFRWLVAEARRRGLHVMDRCNLTVLLLESQADLAAFLAEHEVEVVASLPCYLEENADRQRGQGVYGKSIAALRKLNALGYGTGGPDGRLKLRLVYNPSGPSLPPPQAKLEEDYRRELRTRHGVEFTSLYALANVPISRFLEDLLRRGKLEEYLAKLAAAHNPNAVAGLMCRSTLSIGWDGQVYDCDFNQMLELPARGSGHVRDADPAALLARTVVTGLHCHACTAGAGSSCGGATVRV